MKPQNRRIFLLLVILILLDLIFVGLQVLFEVADYRLLNSQWLLDPQLSLDVEYSYGNAYQHVKQLIVVLLLFFTFIRSGQRVFLAWTIVFSSILADDLFQLHEGGGIWLRDRFDLPVVAGVIPQEYAQFIYFFLVGAVLFLVLHLTLRSSSMRERMISVPLLLLVMFLVFFTVVVDQLDSTPLSYSIPGMTSLLITIEEAGELVVFSLALVYTLYVSIHRFAPPAVVSAIPKSVWRWTLSENEV